MGRIFTLSVVLFCFVSLVNAQLIADFETAGSTPGFTLQEGTGAAVVANPDPAGNSSSKVISYQKVSGNWKAIYLTFASKQNVSSHDALTFKLRTTTVGRVFVKLFNSGTLVLEAWAPEYAFQPEANTWTICKFNTSTLHDLEFDEIQVNACVDNEAVATVWLDDFRLTSPLAPSGEPVITLEVSTYSPSIGESVSFDASGSVDLDGSIVSFTWDFKDGSSDNGATVNHTFVEEGVYKVALDVEDNEGNVATTVIPINVLPVGSKVGTPQLLSSSPGTFEKIEGTFVAYSYENVYNSDEVAIDALITQPDAMVIRVPCFYFEEASYNEASDTWSNNNQGGQWLFRFSTSQVGIHKIKLELTDETGTSVSPEESFEVVEKDDRGYVRLDESNPQYFRHSTGQPFYPLGINVAWNSTKNYSVIMNNLANGGANLIRYWMAPFDRQGLEWQDGYSFYRGLGVYSQEASAELDSILNLSESLGLYVQLTLFQHGMFSTTVDSNWEFNPYNTANGGMLSNPEQYFYNEEAKTQTKKLLRYIVARWGYTTHLFAWELFNEVQFTGNHPSQSAQWSSAVNTWHGEMGDYIKSLDAFDHIVTTSADDARLDNLLGLSGIDNVQYHLYHADLLTVQSQKDKSLRMGVSSLINGEYGTTTNAEVSFDMQRHSIWNGVMTQVPHLMWRWENYSDVTWANLFKFPSQYLSDVDFVSEGILTDWNLSGTAGATALGANGFNSSDNYYGYVFHPNSLNNVTGATCSGGTMQPGDYTITYYNIQSGVTTEQQISVDGSRQFTLPTFNKGIAFKAHLDNPLVTALDEELDPHVRMYPNPSYGELRIESLSEIEELTILDLQGRTVDNIKVNGLSISYMTPASLRGMCLVRVVTTDGTVQKKMIFK